MFDRELALAVALEIDEVLETIKTRSAAVRSADEPEAARTPPPATTLVN